jgi:non-ribosomal peptide synthetase component E (peptide arylation enzyme)
MTIRIQNNLNVSPCSFLTDAGYFSEDNVSFLESRGIDAFIPPDRIRHTEKPLCRSLGRISKNLFVKDCIEKILYDKERENYIR